jgi:hypothetical protein
MHKLTNHLELPIKRRVQQFTINWLTQKIGDIKKSKERLRGLLEKIKKLII